MSDLVAEMAHDVEPWVQPSIDLVLAEYRDLPDVTWGLLHADPESAAFLRQPDGRVALIDWGATVHGPVLYDVASALMYLGGRHRADSFWETYVQHSPAPAAELTEHLSAFTRYRAAVQAAYFSWRIGTQDRTGIDHDGENGKGLRDAEQMLRASGARLISRPS
jgi:homoserine kinase type II